MGKLDWSFKGTLKRMFWPCKTKRANLLYWVVVGSLTTGISGYETSESYKYEKDLEKYRSGQIAEEPQRIDYGVSGLLERLTSDEEKIE